MGKRLPSDAELARRLGVGGFSIRQAMTILAEAGVVRRSRRVGTFAAAQPGPIGRTINLVCGRSLPAMRATAFGRAVLLGVLCEAAEQQAQVRLTAVPDDQLHKGDWCPPSDWDGDAAILFEELHVDPTGRPMVAMEQPGGLARRVSLIGCDWDRGLRQVFAELRRLGHTRIGYVGPTYDLETVSESYHDPRYDAFASGAFALGLRLSADWFIDCRRPRDVPRVDRLFDRPVEHRPTALVLRSEVWPVLAHLIGRGIRIGPDVSVVGLEMAAHWSQWLDEEREILRRFPLAENEMPDVSSAVDRGLRQLHLTHLGRDVEELGRQAVREVVRRWNNPLSPPATVTLPVRLVEGATLGPAR